MYNTVLVEKIGIVRYGEETDGRTKHQRLASSSTVTFILIYFIGTSIKYQPVSTATL